jgi:phosphoglycerol transferase MdoB-like AlkP superfamily enzyme
MMRQLFRSAPVRLALVGFGLFFSLSLFSRLVLLVTARHDLTWDVSLLGVFASGFVFDVAAGIFAAIPWLLLGVLAPARLLKGKSGMIVMGGIMTIFASALIFITTSEWFFWDEFGARFNFIAVDYLIWTQEVLGNLWESYPMVAIISGIVLAGALVTWALKRKGVFAWAAAGTTTWPDRCGGLAVGAVLSFLAGWFVNQSSMPAFTNQYHSELAKNGCWSFMAAFKQMELEYTKWYAKLPQDQALTEAKRLLVTPNETASSPAVDDLQRSIRHMGPEHRWNVVLICMESLSGDYMAYAGNTQNITPNLDRIAKDSIFFESLYATGTRTVRGMEALTLNLPPTPGQSIIYRPEGTDLLTTFSPFLKRGYDCAFFYGGDGRFDYMNRFFETAGCRVMDVGAWKKSDVTFKTSWGACDEDLFNKTISEADRNYAADKPFNYFCMTTSNHRPYDFPAGRIDMPSHNGRRPAVKYSDWAVGNFLENASKRPWFKQTLFIFCADHCASSAGKSDLDVTKFHIPAMIYNPSLVKTQKVSALCSQVDVMPTVLGLLNWNYETLGFGHDRLAPDPSAIPERAFISNYQKIAMLRKDGLAILKPKAEVSLYRCDLNTGTLSPLSPDAAGGLVLDTTSLYQSASWLFSSGHLKKSFLQALPVLANPLHSKSKEVEPLFREGSASPRKTHS